MCELEGNPDETQKVGRWNAWRQKSLVFTYFCFFLVSRVDNFIDCAMARVRAYEIIRLPNQICETWATSPLAIAIGIFPSSHTHACHSSSPKIIINQELI